MKTYGNSLVLEITKDPVYLDLKKIKEAVTLNNLYFLLTVGEMGETVWGEKLVIPKEVPIMFRLRHFWMSGFAIDFQSKFYYNRLPDYIIFDTDEEPTEEVRDIVLGVQGWGIDLGEHGNLDRVKKFKEFMGEEPRFILSPLNPMRYKKEILDYTEKNGVELLSYDIYGSDFYKEWMIYTFTTDYLERFAAYHSQGIVLKLGHNIYDTILTLISYSGKNGFASEKVTEEYEKLFKVDKEEVWRDPGKLPMIKGISSFGNGGISGGSKFVWFNPRNSASNIKLSFDTFHSPILSEEHERNKTELSEFTIPEEFNLIEARQYSDMIGISTLATENPRYKITYDIDEDLTVITLTPRNLFWKEEKVYACTYNYETKNPILIKLQ
jgi:hypothetical protein